MDLIDQTVSGTNEIYLTDSLNTSLLKLKVKTTADTVVPSSNDVIIYVDKSSSSTPTEERKQYVLNLTKPLKFYNQVSDELVEQIEIKGNEIKLEAFVNRMIGTNETGNYVLESEVREEIDSIPITLFEGINYLYTNYTNASITLIYPKDNELNRAFLNNTIYSEHLKNDQEAFSLDDLYFKDAFTKIGNKLNLEVDNASIDCLTSKNNKFSLDSEGNLTINSITTAQQLNFDKQEIGNYIYPVGSIYLSLSGVNPSMLFGGNWSQISGYYLYAGVGGNTAGSNTSGAPSNNTTGSTTLTIDQMPSHTHIQNAHNHSQHPNCWMNDASYYDTRIKSTAGFYAGANQIPYYTGSTTATNQYTGGGQGHTHTLNSHTHSVTPLRYEVYMWKRTA